MLTLFCRVLPIRKKTRFGSIPKAVCKWADWLCRQKDKPKPIGRLFAHFHLNANAHFPMIILKDLRASLFSDYPTFAGLGHAPGADGAGSFDPAKLGKAGKVLKAPLKSPVKRFLLHQPNCAGKQGDGGMFKRMFTT